MNGAVPKALLEALPFPSLLLDSRGRIVTANSLLLEQTRRRADATAGRPFFEEFAGLAGVSAAETEFREAVHGGLLASTFVTRLSDEGEPEGRTFKVYLRSVHGPEPLVLAVFEPISGDAELQARLARLEARLREVSRIKHEISNPLMGLIGSAEILDNDPEMPPGSKPRLSTILAEARRIGERLRELSEVRKG